MCSLVDCLHANGWVHTYSHVSSTKCYWKVEEEEKDQWVENLGDGKVGEDPGERQRGKLGVDMIIFYCIHVGNLKNVNKNSDNN